MAALIAAAAGGGLPALPTRSRTRAAVYRAVGSSVAGMWRQLQGCDDWEGMLDHPVMRGEVARNGELVDACYKAFDLDPSSRRYLSCKHGKDRMLAEVGMPGAGYEVTKYIYAAAPRSGRGRWIGYVAVSTDDMTRCLGRRDVLVSFRGTVAPAEWMANVVFPLKPARLDPSDPRLDVQVETGFLTLYTSAASADETCCRDQLLREVSRLLRRAHSPHGHGGDTSITLAGHSVGGALALLLAYDLAELGLNGAAPVTVFSFGAPRVGNAAFKARCDDLGIKALRVANVNDPFTKLPGVLLNDSRVAAALPPVSCYAYAHVGIELPLHFFSVADLVAVHDLPTYIAALLNHPPTTTTTTTTMTRDPCSSIALAPRIKKPATTTTTQEPCSSIAPLRKKPPTTHAGVLRKVMGLRNAAAILSLGGLLMHTLGRISTSSFFTRY